MIFNIVPGTQHIPGVQNGNFRITQGYGVHPEEYAPAKGHYGYDIADVVAGKKFEIFAPHEGYAKLIKSDTGYGWHIILTSLPNKTNGEGFYSLLGHMSEFFVIKSGHYVPMNNRIGIAGKTGWATGVHCHWLWGNCDANGNLKNKNNGYFGALDQGPYTRTWNADEDSGILVPEGTKAYISLPEAEDGYINATCYHPPGVEF